MRNGGANLKTQCADVLITQILATPKTPVQYSGGYPRDNVVWVSCACTNTNDTNRERNDYDYYKHV